MAVTWRKPENVVKPKKIKPSVKKKIKAIEAAKAIAEATGVPYVPPSKRKDKKRKRQDHDDGTTGAAAGEAGAAAGLRPKKQPKRAKDNKSTSETGDVATNGASVTMKPVKDASLQDLAFVDTTGSGPVKIGKDGKPKQPKAKPVRKQKLLPKRERKELKRLKKMGLARGQTAASIMAMREPEKKEDTRKVRKQRRLLRKKGLFKELAEFEAQVAADKEAKKQREDEEAAAAEKSAAESQVQVDDTNAATTAEASGDAISEVKVEQVIRTTAESKGETIVETVSETVSETAMETIPVQETHDVEPQKKKKKSKKEKKDRETSKSRNGFVKSESLAVDIANGATAVADEEEQADEQITASKRKREALPDPVIPPQKDHRFIVFVGNLPFSATRDEIAHHFKAVHPTNVRLMTEKETGKSRGFAFVEFDRYDYMNSCLQKYHHSHFKQGTEESRRINVELTVGGGGTSDERKSKIKHKNENLRHEQFRRRERAKDDEYRKKMEEKEASKAETEAGAKVQESQNGVHPSRMGRVRQ